MIFPRKLLFLLIKFSAFIFFLSFLISVFKNVSNTASQNPLEVSTNRQTVSYTLTNSNNPFRCYDDAKSILLKDFYRLDCENPFLKNISLHNLELKDDTCELFNQALDGDASRTLFSRIERDFKHFSSDITYVDIKSIETACSGCHHIQLIDGELFIVNRPNALNFQTRSRSVKAMLKEVTDTFKSIGNLEMFIHVRK